VELGGRAALLLGSATFAFEIAQHFDFRQMGALQWLHLAITGGVNILAAGRA
jgi:hypothetical protein